MRALLAEPKVLLLDEPMAGSTRALPQNCDQLTRLVDSGMTIAMVEHELAIMDAFCDPVIVLARQGARTGHDGRVAGNEEVVEAYLVG